MCLPCIVQTAAAAAEAATATATAATMVRCTLRPPEPTTAAASTTATATAADVDRRDTSPSAAPAARTFPAEAPGKTTRSGSLDRCKWPSRSAAVDLGVNGCAADSPAGRRGRRPCLPLRDLLDLPTPEDRLLLVRTDRHHHPPAVRHVDRLPTPTTNPARPSAPRRKPPRVAIPPPNNKERIATPALPSPSRRDPPPSRRGSAVAINPVVMASRCPVPSRCGRPPSPWRGCRVPGRLPDLPQQVR